MNLNATLFGQTIAFIIFVFFCMKYIWPNLIASIEKRQRDIENALNSVKTAQINLKLSQEKAKKYLQKAKIKSRNIILKANQEKETFLKDAIIEAKKKKKEIISQGYLEVLDAKKRMHEELKKDVINLIIMATEKILEDSINEKINNDIIKKSILNLEINI
ncbi:MAG: F0F1 ATP synthase subunit B [Wigglesworthia glossinidia]|nr:F0F1 ATP synthase subunit B [Wigglesworthia glossinidia]